ncbi:alkaline phosphatase D family protein [Kitasatospora sp. NPDC059327]|uniref:alkaline phosphatase D family protein n=1 Tax=Kitasatospora sp. NPDC059327 TaxID=3346803 RepID=UPI00369EE938
MDDSSPTLSDHINSEISRRRVVQLLGAGAVAAAAGSALTGTTTAAADSLPWTGLVAAVLDEVDVDTKACGLKTLLENAGFGVITLDPAKAVRYQAAPSALSRTEAVAAAAANGVQEVALVAFGSFASVVPSLNSSKYTAFVTNQRDSLRQLTRDGGVVLELAQPDKDGVGVSYLPVTDWKYDAIPMHAVRTDFDANTIYPVDTTHPLVSALPKVGGQVFTGRRTERLEGTAQKKLWTSWESIGAWAQMRVLLSCTDGTGFPAVLLEGKGDTVANEKSTPDKGRYLVSSLTIDKCYAADGTTAVESAAAIEDSHKFFNALTAYVQKVRAGTAPGVTTTPAPKAGPLVGHVDETTARILARPGVTGSWKCTVTAGSTVKTLTASTAPANDDTVLFDVTGLTANTSYTFSITPDSGGAFVPMAGKFKTAPVPNTGAAGTSPTKATLGFGSCAHSISTSVWSQVIANDCEGFVMLGDTPYADRGVALGSSPDSSAEIQRKTRKTHREFLAAPGIDNLVKSMPIWGTWDDHDFAGNDTDGRAPAKVDFRKAFVDYRANATFGHGAGAQLLTGRGTGEGVYTSFRRGPVEVFLLDPRWFANATTGVCLGAEQKAWLFKALKDSTAKFKVLASGMTWYDKAGSESDAWSTYTADRNELFEYIKRENIKGCVLLSGDIHVSRVLKNYYTAADGGKALGYDLWEYVVSPLHDRTEAVKHSDTPTGHVQTVATPRTFLKLEAETKGDGTGTLTATWINEANRTVMGPYALTTTQLGY